MRLRITLVHAFSALLFALTQAGITAAQDASAPAAGGQAAAENASNPLAAANNIDLRYQFTSADAGDTHDIFFDGAQMIFPTLKLKYTLHYMVTDVTGQTENDFETLSFKPIYFPYQARLSDDVMMRLAVGGELIIEFGNEAKGIGIGADQASVFTGAAFMLPKLKLVAVPLVQQFLSISGTTDVNTTSPRLIAIKSFESGTWLKLDAKVPFDHVRDTVPATAEVQFGYNVDKSWAVYIEGLVGIGDDKPYDGGVGLGLCRKY
jgi:hypothetical protein